MPLGKKKHAGKRKWDGRQKRGRKGGEGEEREKERLQSRSAAYVRCMYIDCHQSILRARRRGSRSGISTPSTGCTSLRKYASLNSSRPRRSHADASAKWRRAINDSLHSVQVTASFCTDSQICNPPAFLHYRAFSQFRNNKIIINASKKCSHLRC